MPNKYKMVLTPKEFKEISETGKLLLSSMSIEFSPEEQTIFAELLQLKNDLKEIIVESPIDYDFTHIINADLLSKIGEKLLIKIQEKQPTFSSSRIAEYL